MKQVNFMVILCTGLHTAIIFSCSIHKFTKTITNYIHVCANVSVQFIALWLQVIFFTLLIRTNKLSTDSSFINITNSNHTSSSEIQLRF